MASTHFLLKSVNLGLGVDRVLDNGVRTGFEAVYMANLQEMPWGLH